MIIHIDMDAFFASIEQAINPRLHQKPLIVGSRDNKFHTVVCAASYEAKAHGISSGMSSQDAFKLCPDLQFVPADQSKYYWTSQEILKLLKTYGFQIACASIDEFQMDIENLAPGPLVQKIKEQIQATFGITASIGIAKNYLLAKLASKLKKPNGTLLINEDNLAEILEKTPVKKLCGIGEKSQEILYLWGIKTCLDLYQKPASFLERIFGQNGLTLYAGLHCKESLTAQETPEKPKSIGHSYTLSRASENPGFIKAWIRLLSEMVGKRLRENNLVSSTTYLWLNGPEIGSFGRQKSHILATNDSYEICRRSLKIMAEIGLKMPKIRALGITASSLQKAQYPLLFNEEKRRETLLKTLDKINEKLGENTIYPAVVTLTRETHT